MYDPEPRPPAHSDQETPAEITMRYKLILKKIITNRSKLLFSQNSLQNNCNQDFGEIYC